ncbi:MAG: arylsulfatase [Phycisphaerae bacterium]|nr:arylsulfatase [Phycisphaerae bacterium]
MQRRDFLRAIACSAVTASPIVSWAAGRSGSKEAPRPNIVIIMSDDMGYSDIGCYGGEINTPTLDGLAAGGLRFTQFYNTARCCPTRACLLTGLYPHQAGVGHMMDDRGEDGYRGDLNRNCVTIAEVLKTAGYSTYASGKWHVTKKTQPQGPEDKYNWPLQRGFDRYYGTITGAGSFWDPSTLVRDNKMITPPSDPEYQPGEPYYYTDAISDNAARFVREHDRGKPFFMYVAYTAAHWPMHARERDIAKYRGHYDVGYEPIRKARLEKMKKLGVIKSDSELSPAPASWSDIKDKKWEAACMEVYAAMIDSMDQGIGRIVDALKDRGMFDNTLILSLQDNGGCAESGGRGEKPHRRPEKPTFEPLAPEAQHYFGSVPKQTRDGWPVRRGHVMPGPADTYIGYGRNWANVSNTPFREYKHYVHEGGISTPLIAHWPIGIGSKNQLRHQPSHLIDLMATCVDVSGASYPSRYKGQKIKPMEGKSLLGAFADKAIRREIIYWEHEGNRAVRVGKWKIVAKGRAGQDNVNWELYDVEADRSELHNLAGEQPERLKKMVDIWLAYAERANVLPWPVKAK